MKATLLVAAGLACLVGAFAIVRTPKPRSVPPRTNSGPVLVVGSISSTPRDEIDTHEPFVDYLARHLPGDLRVRIAVPESMSELIEMVRREEVDLFLDSPFPVAHVAARTGAVPFLRRWKKGVAEYHSVVFVRSDSGIHSLADLRGKLVAFKEPFSTSAYLLPKALLRSKGLDVVLSAAPVPGKIAYEFAGDNEATLVRVFKGRAAGGGMDARQLDVLSAAHPGVFRVLARSIDVPRHVLAHRPGLDPELVARIAAVLIGAEKSEDGRRMLHAFERTRRFEPLASEAIAEVAGMARLVEDELGD